MTLAIQKFLSDLFRWFFREEAHKAIAYYREIGVIVPLGVMVVFLLTWLLEIWVRM